MKIEATLDKPFCEVCGDEFKKYTSNPMDRGNKWYKITMYSKKKNLFTGKVKVPYMGVCDYCYEIIMKRRNEKIGR